MLQMASMASFLDIVTNDTDIASLLPYFGVSKLAMFSKYYHFPDIKLVLNLVLQRLFWQVYIFSFPVLIVCSPQFDLNFLSLSNHYTINGIIWKSQKSSDHQPVYFLFEY